MNEPHKPSLQLVAQWVQKAENDLKTAEHTFKLPAKDCPYDTICFHAQQCVEKYLKALLTFLEIDFPKTHDVGELIQLLPPSHRPPMKIEDQEKLTFYATINRYPGVEDPLTSVEASEALTLARQTRETIREQLPKEV